jgi:hypothetical protein
MEFCELNHLRPIELDIYTAMRFSLSKRKGRDLASPSFPLGI